MDLDSILAMLKHLRWLMMLAGFVVAFLFVGHEGKQAIAGNPGYLYSLLGEKVLGFIAGGVFGLAGLLFGALLQGFIEGGKETIGGLGCRPLKKTRSNCRRN